MCLCVEDSYACSGAAGKGGGDVSGSGVPTFSMVGYVTSPYAVNSSTNFVVTGKHMGDWLVDELGKKGNVLVVEGIPGTSTSDSLDRGIKLGLATSPDIKIVGDVAGMWTDQVAQAEVQKWLANHPGDLDGVSAHTSASPRVVARPRTAHQRERFPIPSGRAPDRPP